LSSVILCVK